MDAKRCAARRTLVMKRGIARHTRRGLRHGAIYEAAGIHHAHCSASAAWPLRAHAQQPSMPVIGVLNRAAPEAIAHLLAAFRQGLAEAGYLTSRSNTAWLTKDQTYCLSWRAIWFGSM
jgi:hypothetical protein